MKSIIFRIILIISILSYSCQNKKEFSPAVNIKLENPQTYQLSESEILYPLAIAYSNNLLICLDDTEDKFIKILSPENQLVFEYGTIGNGPGEFLQPSNIQTLPSNDPTVCIGVYDGTTATYSVITIRDLARPDIEQTQTLKRDRQTAWAYKANNGYVLSPILDSSYLLLCTKDQNIIARNKTFPKTRKGVPFNSLSIACCSGPRCTSPQGDLFAINARYSGDLQVFKVKEKSIEPFWNFNQFDMDYDIGPNDIPLANDNSRHAYTDLCFSEKYLYGLYSGKSAKSENATASSEIHVFDLNGKHIKKYILDKPIWTIAVNQDKELACISEIDGEPYLLKYRLE